MSAARLPNTHRQQSGFTLIEILIAISLTVIISIAAAGLFFTTLIGSTKQEVISAVKDEGDYALSQMEFLLRNAVTLEVDPSTPTASKCATNMDSITFRSKDEGITTLKTITNSSIAKIASVSASPVQTVYLTSNNATLTNLKFNCEQALNNYGTYITISFTLQKQSPDVNRPNTVNENFTTSVNIRNL